MEKALKVNIAYVHAFNEGSFYIKYFFRLAIFFKNITVTTFSRSIDSFHGPFNTGWPAIFEMKIQEQFKSISRTYQYFSRTQATFQKHKFTGENPYRSAIFTAQKMKFYIKDFFGKHDQIRSFLWIWSHLLLKSLMENLIFCAVKSQFGMGFLL